jgi:hypothetical protein
MSKQASQAVPEKKKKDGTAAQKQVLTAEQKKLVK